MTLDTPWEKESLAISKTIYVKYLSLEYHLNERQSGDVELA